MFKTLLIGSSYLLLPFAVGQYVLRPLAYSFLNLTQGVTLKSWLLGGYLLATAALVLFMGWELWRSRKQRSPVVLLLLILAFASQNPYQFAWRDAQLLGDLQRLQQLNLDPSNYQARVVGNTLELRGTISVGMWQTAASLLERHPNLREVNIQSPGGQVSPAIAIADQLRLRNLNTYTSGQCFSACTLIFLAGQNRALGPYAQLGFHAAFRPTADGQRIASPRINQAIIQRFVSTGVEPSFAIRAWSTPSDDLWLPDTEQLLAARYATETR